MKNRFKNVFKNILGIVIFYSVFLVLGYFTYFVFFPERTLTWYNFIGIYAILLQISILISVTTKQNDK